MKMRLNFPRSVAILAAALSMVGTASAQTGTNGADWALVFIFAFVGGLILFAYVASKLMMPAKPSKDDRVIPLPMVTRRH